MPHVTLDNTITIAISVKDRHASADWFHEMFGFELLYHADDHGWSEMGTKTEGVVLGLGEQAEPAPGNAIPVFGVDDIDSARSTMEQQNVAFDGDTIVLDGMVKLASFFDPDGNAMMIAQDLSKN